MEQEVKQLNITVRDVQTTNREILVRLSSIQASDSQVCTCSCHSPDAGLNAFDKLREHESRIAALENLVKQLLTRDRNDRTDNDCVKSEYNARNEFKYHDDARDKRNHGAETRVIPREVARDGAFQTTSMGESYAANTGHIPKKNIDRWSTSLPPALGRQWRTGARDEKTEWQKSTARVTERTEKANDTQKVQEIKGPSKSPLQEGSRNAPAQNAQQARWNSGILRPNVTQISHASVEFDTKPNPEQSENSCGTGSVGSITEGSKSSIGDLNTRDDEGSTTGPLAEEGATDSTETEDEVLDGVWRKWVLDYVNSVDQGATGSTETEDEVLDVEIIHQDDTRLFAKGTDWTHVAQMELDSGMATAIKDLEGAHTAICLDISESMMNGNAWRQAKRFLLEYIEGLLRVAREHKVTDEYVSFVTFGHETRVVKRMTNRYEELHREVESVKLGGPSPLYGGLYMALVSLIQSDHCTMTVNGMTVYSKIILISDGVVTETRQLAGPDLMESKGEYNTDLLDARRQILRKGIDMYCVPVGNTNMKTMDMMSAGYGRIWPYEEGEKLARRYFLTKAAGPGIMQGLMGLPFMFGPSFDPNFKSEVKLSDSDRLHMLDIVNEAHRRSLDDMAWKSESEDMYNESDNERLPAVGSRVRRGVDWRHGDQDENGPGTVTGHTRFRDKLWVEWDKGDDLYSYRYGESSCYEVLTADDIREPNSDGSLAVGCVVKPNARTKAKRPDLQTFDRGVVLKVTDKHKLLVRWNSGTKAVHEYVPGVRQEVAYIVPADSAAPAIHGQKEESKSKQSHPKNKNKIK